MSKAVFALNGFLGKPGDWNIFPSITHPIALENEHLSFKAWAKQFNQTIPQREDKNILIGYSLGGRLAMHLLLDSPDHWAGAILVSVHPGLNSEVERAKRLELDRSWGERFLSDSWENLMDDWNRNPIFNNRPFPSTRLEHEFNRQLLSRQLNQWSLGRQKYLIPKLLQLKLPLLVLAGEEDKKFVSLSANFAPFAQVKVIANASHRVPWDIPKQFNDQIETFIREI